MDNKQDVALVEAVTLRERECASMRRYTVTAAAFAVLIVIGDIVLLFQRLREVFSHTANGGATPLR